MLLLRTFHSQKLYKLARWISDTFHFFLYGDPIKWCIQFLRVDSAFHFNVNKIAYSDAYWGFSFEWFFKYSIAV